MPKFIVQNLKTQEEQEYELNQDNILFGRTNTCDVELPLKSISRRHAEITQDAQDFFISDLESGNGTFLNDKKLRPHEKNLLRSGDMIRIEDYEIRFLLEEDGSMEFEEDTDTDILEIRLIKKMMKALDRDEQPSLEVLNGSLAGTRTPLPENKPEFIIGRGESCDLTISENVLSRSHAKFEPKWGGIVVNDLGSKNGTFVNNEPIQEKLLRDGDRVMLGTIKILYRNPKEVKAQIAHQEISRKKKEAALEEAEALARKQLEEEKKDQEAAAEEQAKKEAEAKEVEETLDKEPEERPDEEKEGAAPSAPAETPPSPSAPTPASIEKTQFSTLEKVFIVLGILVGLVAIVGLISLLL